MATILVVDDERQIRESLSALLCARGVGLVETAANAREATEIALRQPPDLLIVDWMLGDDVDGLQLAETLRQTNPHLETIFVTGYLSSELQKKTQTRTRTRVFSKPCPHEELMQAIDEALPKSGGVPEQGVGDAGP